MQTYTPPLEVGKRKRGRKPKLDGQSRTAPRTAVRKETCTSGSVSTALPTCLVEAVDTAVAEAFAKAYSADPLIPDEVAALRGPVDSVLRRHGLLIETALAVALDLSPEVEVMTQVAVPVSDAAIQLCLSNADEKTIGLTLPVSGTIAKTAVIDVVAYYPRNGRLVAVSVKRGGGAQGGTAARHAAIELRAAAMILRAMLMGRGRMVSSTEVVTVDYLGRSGIIVGTVLGVDQLDAFFGLPVRATIDAMTGYMSAEVGRRIDEAIETLVRKRMRKPVPTLRLLQTHGFPTAADLADAADIDRQAALDAELIVGRNAAALGLDVRANAAERNERTIVSHASSAVGPDGKRRRGRKPKAQMVEAEQVGQTDSAAVKAPARTSIRLVQPDISAAVQPAAQTASPPPSLAECLSILPRIRGRQSRLHA